MTLGERIKYERERNNLTQEEVAKAIEVTKQAVYKYEAGIVTNIPTDKIEIMATMFGVSPAYLVGWEEQSQIEPAKEALFFFDKKTHMIPLFESAAAGFGLIADNSIVDYIPLNFNCDIEAQETICVKVHGDSMYPKIEDGDIVQVHKQESVDNGSLVVVLLDGEEGLVKNIVYGDDWIELRSINPMYKTMRFDKQDVMRLRVVGLVKKIIKDA